MQKVITFGELMLRLAPENYLRFVQSEKYEATFGGAEAHVAVSLANYGIDAAFVTKLPEHEIGQAAINSLRKFGVDTGLIVRGGDRVGIYFPRFLRKSLPRRSISSSSWLGLFPKRYLSFELMRTTQMFSRSTPGKVSETPYFWFPTGVGGNGAM